jgi:hypothetical protein
MRSFGVAFAFAAAFPLAAGLGCAARIQPIHRPPTPAEIREINAPEGPIEVEPLARTGWSDRKWNVARVVSADAEKIVVAPAQSQGAPFALRLGDVANFHLRGQGRGAVIGAAIGAASALLVVLVLTSPGSGHQSHNDVADFSGPLVRPTFEFAAGMALAGALPGAVIGAIVGSPKDFPVALGPAPPTEYASPTSAPQLALVPPASAKAATVVVSSAAVRSAPFEVAPVIATLTRGQRLDVEPTPHAGWRVAFLSEGRVGYIQDAQLEVDRP